MAYKNSVPAVEKTMLILKHMSASSKSEWGVTELASELNLNKSTVFSILNTMISFEFIDKNPVTDKYALGSGLFNLVNSYYKKNPIRTAFETVVTPFHSKLPECINCFILRNNMAYILASFSSNYVLRVEMPEGTYMPPIYSSAGKILLSSLNDSDIEEIYLQCLHEASAKKPPSLLEFLLQINTIREQGCAFNLSEYENGICSVAVPVRNHNSQIVAAVNIVVPEIRFKNNRNMYIDSCKRIGREISEHLGYLSPTRN